MKKTYESPTTEFVELDTQNVLLGSYSGEGTNIEDTQNSTQLPIDKEFN